MLFFFIQAKYNKYENSKSSHNSSKPKFNLASPSPKYEDIKPIFQIDNLNTKIQLEHCKLNPRVKQNLNKKAIKPINSKHPKTTNIEPEKKEEKPKISQFSAKRIEDFDFKNANEKESPNQAKKPIAPDSVELKQNEPNKIPPNPPNSTENKPKEKDLNKNEKEILKEQAFKVKRIRVLPSAILETTQAEKKTENTYKKVNNNLEKDVNFFCLVPDEDEPNEDPRSKKFHKIKRLGNTSLILNRMEHMNELPKSTNSAAEHNKKNQLVIDWLLKKCNTESYLRNLKKLENTTVLKNSKVEEAEKTATDKEESKSCSNTNSDDSYYQIVKFDKKLLCFDCDKKFTETADSDQKQILDDLLYICDECYNKWIFNTKTEPLIVNEDKELEDNHYYCLEENDKDNSDGYVEDKDIIDLNDELSKENSNAKAFEKTGILIMNNENIGVIKINPLFQRTLKCNINLKDESKNIFKSPKLKLEDAFI